MSARVTKIGELEAELRVYSQECQRLRRMTERAILASGEIDVKQIERKA
jgi:hypothetical protein